MYPTLNLLNQFGEQSTNFILGGSSEIRAKFVVDTTNADGITGLVAQGIDDIFMHTSTTPSAGNPNPISGYILAKLSKGFASFQSLQWTATPPQSGSSLLVASAGLSVGSVYVITILGNTSQAQWEVLGVAAGQTAALGLAFVAIATSCTGTGAVQIPKVGGTAIVSINPVGNPSVGSLDDGSGGSILLACYKAGGTISAPTFSGSALGTHAHDLLIKGSQAASTTNDIAAYAGPILGKQEATDATILGSGSAANGGVMAASAGTPAGTISAPVLTGANSIGAPVDGAIIELCFNMIPLAAAIS